ncbi:hypothetical protein ACLF3G_29555, partial [Falsiroseomonas sp. HC035]|uniref:hypothetical protein n=1 Tax=Falsiroseomonas sp. HC035 TaxID=3390999 RepID=UPI003D311246
AVGSFNGTAGTTLGLTSTDALTVIGASGTAVALNAASLDLTGAVAGTTSVGLTATTGGISQSAAITTPSLTASAVSGSIALNSANAVGSFNGVAGGALGFVSTDALTVTGASGTAVALNAASLDLTGAVAGTTSVGLTA